MRRLLKIVHRLCKIGQEKDYLQGLPADLMFLPEPTPPTPHLISGSALACTWYGLSLLVSITPMFLAVFIGGFRAHGPYRPNFPQFHKVFGKFCQTRVEAGVSSSKKYWIHQWLLQLPGTGAEILSGSDNSRWDTSLFSQFF